MLNWLRRRRLSAEAQRKLRLLQARAEDAIVETHVSNLLDMFESIGDEVDLDRGLEIYREIMGLDEEMETVVSTRLLARLENRGGRRGTGRFRRVFREG